MEIQMATFNEKQVEKLEKLEKFKKNVRRIFSKIFGEIEKEHSSILFYEYMISKDNILEKIHDQLFPDNPSSWRKDIINEKNGEIHKKFEKIRKLMFCGYFPGLSNIRDVIYHSTEKDIEAVDMFCEYYEVSNLNYWAYNRSWKDSGFLNVVGLLTLPKKNTDFPPNIDYESSLQFACGEKEDWIVKLILSDPRLQEIPMCVLEYACEKKDIKMVKRLLKNPKMKLIDSSILTYVCSCDCSCDKLDKFCKYCENRIIFDMLLEELKELEDIDDVPKKMPDIEGHVFDYIFRRGSDYAKTRMDIEYCKIGGFPY